MVKGIITFVLISLTSGVFAQSSGLTTSEPIVSSENIAIQGGFTGPNAGLSTVMQARQLKDDTWVVLEGNIIKRVGHDLYEFTDSSGSIYVEIDNKQWQGQSVTAADKTRIEGKVDKDWNSTKIDVKTIRVLK